MDASYREEAKSRHDLLNKQLEAYSNAYYEVLRQELTLTTFCMIFCATLIVFLDRLLGNTIWGIPLRTWLTIGFISGSLAITFGVAGMLAHLALLRAQVLHKKARYDLVVDYIAGTRHSSGQVAPPEEPPEQISNLSYYAFNSCFYLLTILFFVTAAVTALVAIGALNGQAPGSSAGC